MLVSQFPVPKPHDHDQRHFHSPTRGRDTRQHPVHLDGMGETDDHFIDKLIGTDQLVDEMVISFTHTIEMDWMLPGIPPTGRRVEVPLVVIVRFRDGKLAHEHIYWDQASVLAQLGLLDSEKLPAAGAESAQKVLDPAMPANMLIKRARN